MQTARCANLVGSVFGNLTVMSFHSLDSRSRATWNCKCKCGNRVVKLGKYLIAGDALSCGCLGRKPYTRKISPVEKITETEKSI